MTEPLTFPVPAALCGDQLETELAAAGFAGSVTVNNSTGLLEVAGVDAADSQAVKEVVAAHVYVPPPPPTPAEKLAAAGLTIEDLKALGVQVA